MRALKWALFALLGATMALLFINRAPVVEAYTTERPEPDFRLDGLSLEVEQGQRSPSPYLIPLAPDTRELPLDIRYAHETASGAIHGISGGGATLSGTVTGPTGPLPNAFVRLERQSLDGAISELDVVSGPDGAWNAGGLLGGRYRVRAFVPGQFASGASTVLFLNARATATVDLAVVAADGTLSVEFFAGPEMLLAGDDTVAATLMRQSVDELGRLRLSPAVGLEVRATLRGAVSLLSADTVRADTLGTVRFRLQCDAVATNVLVVQYESEVKSFALPGCVAVRTPPPGSEAADAADE